MSEGVKWALFLTGTALMAVWGCVWFTSEWNRRVARPLKRRRVCETGKAGLCPRCVHTAHDDIGECKACYCRSATL